MGGHSFPIIITHGIDNHHAPNIPGATCCGLVPLEALEEVGIGIGVGDGHSAGVGARYAMEEVNEDQPYSFSAAR